MGYQKYECKKSKSNIQGTNFSSLIKFPQYTSDSFNSTAETVSLRRTVTLEGTGKCSTSSLDFPSFALFLLKISFVGSGCIGMGRKSAVIYWNKTLMKMSHYPSSYHIVRFWFTKCHKIRCRVINNITPHLLMHAKWKTPIAILTKTKEITFQTNTVHTSQWYSRIQENETSSLSSYMSFDSCHRHNSHEYEMISKSQSNQQAPRAWSAMSAPYAFQIAVTVKCTSSGDGAI